MSELVLYLLEDCFKAEPKRRGEQPVVQRRADGKQADASGMAERAEAEDMPKRKHSLSLRLRLYCVTGKHAALYTVGTWIRGD